MLKTGGKLIAKGSYGCVFDPPLKCVEHNQRKKGYVSKLMKYEHAESELKEQEIIDDIDPSYNYHLRLGDICTPDEPDNKTDKQLKGCILHGENLNDIYNTEELQIDYSIMHIEYGGIGLDKYLQSNYKMNDLNYCEKMLFDFTRIIYGLEEFSKNNIGHFDIKSGNIVYNEKNNRFNYIDFGYSGKYSDFLLKHIKWGESYWVNPLERAFIDIKNPFIIVNFYKPLFELSKSQLKLNEILLNKQSKYRKIYYNLKLYLSTFIKGYRKEFRKNYTELEINNAQLYGPYGFNKYTDPSDTMIYDYIEEIRILLNKKMTFKQIIENMQLSILQKLNTFSLSLVMIELLHRIIIKKTPVLSGKIIVSYESKHDNLKSNFRENIKRLSPVLSEFYDIILKMNVPSYPKRISTREVLELYIKNIYEPILKKYNLKEMDFIKNKPVINISEINSTHKKDKKIKKSTTLKPQIKNQINKQINNQINKQINNQINKQIKKCPDDKVLNPITNRCIKKDGAVYKSIKKKGVHVSNKSTTLKKQIKKCPNDKILNPITNRCIKKDGAVYKKLQKL